MKVTFFKKTETVSQYFTLFIIHILYKNYITIPNNNVNFCAKMYMKFVYNR